MLNYLRPYILATISLLITMSATSTLAAPLCSQIHSPFTAEEKQSEIQDLAQFYKQYQEVVARDQALGRQSSELLFMKEEFSQKYSEYQSQIAGFKEEFAKTLSLRDRTQDQRKEEEKQKVKTEQEELINLNAWEIQHSD